MPLLDAHRFVLAAARSPGVEVRGLYTHLPFSDAAGLQWAASRIARFDALVAALARDGLDIPVTQARASAALLAGIDDHCTAVSPGALLYGLSPLDVGLVRLPPLRPVMERIKSRLIQVSLWAADRTPGYEGRYSSRVTRASGVMPFGRVDGSRAPISGMLIDGVAAPVLGVSLEHTVLDLSAIETPRVGQEVVVLGASGDRSITLAEIARWQGIGVNDVLMAVNGRIPILMRAS